jgi:hypothetical protein
MTNHQTPAAIALHDQIRAHDAHRDAVLDQMIRDVRALIVRYGPGQTTALVEALFVTTNEPHRTAAVATAALIRLARTSR